MNFKDKFKDVTFYTKYNDSTYTVKAYIIPEYFKSIIFKHNPTATITSVSFRNGRAIYIKFKGLIMSIQQAIDNKPLIQQIVANLNAGKSSKDIFESTGYESTDLNLPARNFIQALLFVWFNHKGHYCNWQFRQSFLSNMSLSTSLDTLSKLPKEHYDLFPTYILNKVKQHNSTYTLDVKQLQFDEFALATFTMWLESKKKLTSTECLAMLKQCNRLSTLPEHAEQTDSKLKYINLLWEHTPSKSIELCKYYVDNFYNSNFHSKLPVAVINSRYDLSSFNDTDIRDISFNISWYQSFAKTHHIPVSQSVMTTQWSTVYQWISGIPKSTPLNAEGIAIAIDQIIILTAAESKLPNLAQFINKLKQQLIDELLSKRYAECGIKQLLADRLSNLKPIQSILGDLHERL